MDEYLRDILSQLIETASELKATATTDFEFGVVQGYYETLSRLLNQAEAMGIADRLPSELRTYQPEVLLRGS